MNAFDVGECVSRLRCVTGLEIGREKGERNRKPPPPMPPMPPPCILVCWIEPAGENVPTEKIGRLGIGMGIGIGVGKGAAIPE